MKLQTLSSCARLHKSHNLTHSQLKRLQKDEPMPIFKALLKVRIAQTYQDKNDSLLELDAAKKLLETNPSSQNLANCESAAQLFVLSHKINALWLLRRYQEAHRLVHSLRKTAIHEKDLKQVLDVLFGCSSLVRIHSYSVQENHEFKYPAATQVRFLFFLARVKLAFGQDKEAQAAVSKLIELQKTQEFPKQLSKDFEYIKSILERGIGEANRAAEVQIRTENEEFNKLILELLSQERNLFHSKQPEYNVVPFLGVYLRWIHKSSPSLMPAEMLEWMKNLPQAQKMNQTQLKYTALFKQAVGLFEPKLDRLAALHTKSLILTGFNRLEISPALDGAGGSRQTPYFGLPQDRVIPEIRAQKKSGRKIGSISIEPINKSQAEHILNSCMKGSYLTKINVGNYESEKRFVRLTDKGIRWASKEKHIDQSFSEVKWKHILGIVYGKVSSNLNKKAHDQLEPWKCFSVISEDRSYDFCVEDEGQVFFWLQGISYKLQLFHKNIEGYPFYSKGRALWKMMLMKKKFHFLHKNSKFSILNCGGLIRYRQRMEERENRSQQSKR